MAYFVLFNEPPEQLAVGARHAHVEAVSVRLEGAYFHHPALRRAQVVGFSVLLRHGYGAYDCEQRSE